MVNPAKARDDGDESADVDDDDLAQQAETEKDTGSKKAPPQGDAGDGDTDDNEEEKSAKQMLALREEELVTAKKNIRTLTKKLNDLLAKVGVKDGEDPEDLAAQLRKANARAEALLRENRRAQVVEAVREVLSTEKYRDYAGNVKYIVPTLALDEDADVTTDGRYDAEALADAAKRAVKQYAEDNPRPSKRDDAAGGPGGEAARKGSPLPRSEEEELARLEGMFGVKVR